MKIALIDHFDSFTYNLRDLCQRSFRPDAIRVFNPLSEMQEILSFDADIYVIGPGPGKPSDYPLSFNVLNHFYGKKPILGICLGMQLVNEFLGGTTLKADKAMHGKVSLINCLHNKFWQGLPPQFKIMRYHSLYIDLAEGLEVLATAREDSLPMAVKGELFLGLQYHPESFASEYGEEVLKRFCHVH